MGQKAAIPADQLGMDAGLPEARLWAEALKLMLLDARDYWRGKQGHGVHARSFHLEQAFDDVMRCGPMIRHCCSFLDLEPDWISEGFIRWCEGCDVTA